MTGVIWYERTLRPCTSRNIREGTEVITLRVEQPKFTAATPMPSTNKTAFVASLIVSLSEDFGFDPRSRLANKLVKNVHNSRESYV